MEIQMGPPITLSGDEAKAFLRALKGEAGGSGQKIEPDIMAVRLKDHLALFQDRHKFEAGQLVKLKPSFTLPNDCFGPDQMAIVVEALAEPIFFKAASPAREQGARLDLRLMWVCPNHDGLHFGCFESALFEPWPANG